MSHTPFPIPNHPGEGSPQPFEPYEPGMPPVEPDTGPLPSPIPDDPEHHRIRDPAEIQPLQAQARHRPGKGAACH
jgi:hypothetical protein